MMVADAVKPDMGESDSKKSIETCLKTCLAFRNGITRATLRRFANGKKQIVGDSLFYKKQPINGRDWILLIYYELKLWMSEGSRMWCILGLAHAHKPKPPDALLQNLEQRGFDKKVLQLNYDIIDVFIN